MSLRDALMDGFLKSQNAIHRGVLALTGGRLGSTLASMPVVRLRHIGRRSGKQYETLLTVPVQDDDTYVLVASKGGDDRDPDWYLNLVENPDTELLVDGAVVEVRTRVANAQEKADLWPRVVATYKGYAGYQRRTDRDIPLVICEPKGA